MKELVPPYIALFATGVFGSYVAKKVQGGALPVWAPIAPSIVSGVLWGLISKKSHNLSLMSVLVDVIYTAAFVFGFFLLGDRLTPLQIAGLIVSLVGVAMMAA
jgi:hypothetical protein